MVSPDTAMTNFQNISGPKGFTEGMIDLCCPPLTEEGSEMAQGVSGWDADAARLHTFCLSTLARIC